MRSLIRFILGLSPAVKKSLYLAIVITTLLSLLEAGTVGLVYPALLRGLRFASGSFLQADSLYHSHFGNTNEEALVLVVLLGLLILGSGARVAIYKITTKAGANVAATEASKLFSSFLNSSFGSFTEEDAQSLQVSLTEHVRLLAISTIQFLQLISSAFVLLCYIVLLFFFRLISGVYAFLAITVVYAGLLFTTRGRIEVNTRQVHLLSHANSKLITSGIDLFREIKINSLENAWAAKQAEAIKGERYYEGEIQFLGQFPRPLVEALIWIAVVAGFITLTLTDKTNNLPQGAAQLLFTFVLGQKVLPIMQNVYFSIACINSGELAIRQFEGIMKKTNTPSRDGFERNELELVSIELSNVNHRYPKRGKDVFSDNVNLAIRKGMIIGLSGRSGSGKSTLVDIISGLIEPRYGDVIINGVSCAKDLSIVRRVGYAGQASGILSGTISQNIGFSSYGAVVDHANVTAAAKMACLHEVITSLPNGYNTLIGDNDVSLSGGEKQRLAIARALYKKPDLLILDEATTGLDYETESILLESLIKERHSLMIIMCTHDQRLLDCADYIYHI